MSPTVASNGRIFATRAFRAIGTMASLAVDGDEGQADEAEGIMQAEIEAIDLTCSRFRPDSELAYLHATAGQAVEVSSLLFEALEVAYAVAERTQGAVDPTVGNAVSGLGYDRDFDQIGTGSKPSLALGAAPGFRQLELDQRSRTVRIPTGVRLDLGSSAKAFLVDRAAMRIFERVRAGVLVSIGGDVAVAGPPPPQGWAVGIAVDSATGADDVDQVVAIRGGGLASSSTAVRTWVMGGERLHHIVDPESGNCAAPYWTLASVAGASCVDANALSTAAIVWGAQALERLQHFGQAVRLLRHDGQVFTLGGWPAERAT